jgi:hypothetical protein
MGTSDDTYGNGPYWRHCGAGMHIGRMNPKPLVGEFDAVLTLAAEPGKLDRELPHRWLPMSYIKLDIDQTWDAIHWVLAQFHSDRKILVRSEGGLQRPALVVASAFVKLGATPSEATFAVRKYAPNALTDWRYQQFVTALFEALRT